MQKIAADICLVLDGVELPLSAAALGTIGGAATAARPSIDAALLRRDLDGVLRLHLSGRYTSEAFVRLASAARHQLMHAVHRAALAGLRQHATSR